MFSAMKYQQMYADRFANESKAVEILVNADGGFISVQATALVTKYEELDLTEGGTIKLGDLRVMLLQADIERLNIPRLGLDDRVVVDGIAYAVIHWDSYTRSVGSTTLAVDLICRGGGSA